MIVISVASGTSADGLDVGIVDLAWADHGSATIDVRVLDSRTEPWPDELRERLLGLLPPATTTAAELCAVDTAVGRAVAAAAVRAAERARTLGCDPELLVSPGQTVHHEVLDGQCLGTLQLGQPAWAAEATGLPVVSDLRARDVAAGGHGAPLVARFDELWLAGTRGPRAALNLGGIANVTVVAPGRPTTAWDTGPANCLLDLAAARATAGEWDCDRDGALARRGQVDPRLLERLLAHPYFPAAPPASTGRETFSAAYLDDALEHAGPLSWEDVLATLTELTARTVADGLTGVLTGAGQVPLAEVVASGGGTANPALMVALARHLAPATLRTSDELGIPAGGKEAVMWALLGFLVWYGVPGASSATGASHPRLLGRISPGEGPLVLPAPWATPPRRLRVRDDDEGAR
ncbi:MAG TPA: anhydro-N-acetylmuramic acid kinase [Nocardioidaceae bacterium]|nr:anhydro-N-acetylmuramic acid kinase [Nocardioidaceae bacterium]